MNERLKQLREYFSLTQQELADRIGVKRTSIALCESGRNKLSEPTLHLICREFDINEKWLRDGTGDMFLPESVEPLDTLARIYNLSMQETELLRRYVGLGPERRNHLLNIFEELASFVESGAADNG